MTDFDQIKENIQQHKQENITEQPIDNEEHLQKKTTAKATSKMRSKAFWHKELWQPPKFIGYRICAVIAALLLWVYVVMSQNTTTDTVYTVPLEIRNLSSELALLETTNQVQIRLQGSSSELNRLSSSSINAYLDFTGVKEGSTSLKVNVDVPGNLQLISVTPETVEVTLEPITSRSFPVKVNISGQPATNYTLLEAVLSPGQITLSGAREYIEAVDSVVATADVTGLDNNFNDNLHLQVRDIAGNELTDHFTVTPAVVNVMIPVVSDMPEKNLTINAAVIGQPAEGYQISRIIVEPATVVALGEQSQLNNIYYLETEPINVTDLKDDYSQTVNVVYNGNITLSHTSVKVVVQIEPVSTATYTRDIVHFQNLAEGLTGQAAAGQINIVVSGAETYLDSVSANEIVPYVNCSSITGPGEYTLPLSATLPVSVSLVSIDPQQINVTIMDSAE